MVYFVGEITGKEAISAQKRLVSLLSNNLKQEYLEMCGIVRARVSLAVVISNTLLLYSAREREAYICQRPDLVNG